MFILNHLNLGIWVSQPPYASVLSTKGKYQLNRKPPYLSLQRAKGPSRLTKVLVCGNTEEYVSVLP